MGLQQQAAQALQLSQLYLQPELASRQGLYGSAAGPVHTGYARAGLGCDYGGTSKRQREVTQSEAQCGTFINGLSARYRPVPSSSFEPHLWLPEGLPQSAAISLPQRAGHRKVNLPAPSLQDRTAHTGQAGRGHTAERDYFFGQLGTYRLVWCGHTGLGQYRGAPKAGRQALQEQGGGLRVCRGGPDNPASPLGSEVDVAAARLAVRGLRMALMLLLLLLRWVGVVVVLVALILLLLLSLLQLMLLGLVQLVLQKAQRWVVVLLLRLLGHLLLVLLVRAHVRLGAR